MEDFETLGDYLAEHNPFALKDEKNRIRHFKTREEIYKFVLEDIRKYCKRGYIELALLIKHLTQFDDETCQDIANIGRKNYPEIHDEPLYLDWEDIEHQRGKLEAIIKTLHLLTETEFDWASFEYTWLYYKVWVINKNKEYGKS